jgi:hypothetical protein
MSTTNHVRLNNIAPNSTANAVNWLWSVTRALKKAGWKFKASSDGTTKISNSDPAADNWGAGSVTNAGASAATIVAPTAGRATITGLTGIVASDKGRFLLISGAATGANNNQHQIEEVLSATSVQIDARNFAVASDANNGSLTWSILDPTTETYPSALTTPVTWWCGQGPSILRIPFTSASTGTFIKGENITQATTLAEGEVLGYTFSGGVGYLNVAPRVRGSGGNPHGWATGNVITGSSSGASLTQVGTVLEYVYEVVIAKPASSAFTVQLLFGQFETVAESAEMFSFCATQAGCTATVHPGGGGTGNAFGAHAWVGWGTGSAPGAGVGILAVTPVRGNVICVDAIPEQNYSADGSWSLVYSFVTSGNPDGFSQLGFQRLDDIEDADFAPYVSINHGGTKTLYSHTRTSAGTIPTIAFSQGGSQAFQVGITRVCLNGWRRRGLTSESFCEFEPCILSGMQSNNWIQVINSVEVTRIATSPDTTARLREPIWVVSAGLGSKVFKGTFKWLYLFAGEHATKVFGTDPAWVQTGSISPGVVIGPHDGTLWVLN